MDEPIRQEHSITVADAEAGARLDRVLSLHFAEISRSRFKALIEEGMVTADGRTIVEPSYRVKHGERLAVSVPPPAPAEPEGEDIALAIVHEDEHLIVIDKPAGLVVHPGAGNWTGTLVNALIAHCGDSLSGIGGVRRPGIVHRLDKDTSGLMVVAKTDAAHAGLSEQFAAHGRDGRLERAYAALVWGAPKRMTGTVEGNIARKETNRQKMAVTATGGRHATTRYRVAEHFPPSGGKIAASLVQCHLETGRTHQIRVHMAHIGHPLLGDRVYGAGFAASARALPDGARKALEELGRQALHAELLGFEHPATGERLRFESPLPEDLHHLVNALRLARWN